MPYSKIFVIRFDVSERGLLGGQIDEARKQRRSFLQKRYGIYIDQCLYPLFSKFCHRVSDRASDEPVGSFDHHLPAEFIPDNGYRAGRGPENQFPPVCGPVPQQFGQFFCRSDDFCLAFILDRKSVV